MKTTGVLRNRFSKVKNVLIDLTLDEEVQVPKKQVVEVVGLTKDSDNESESREEILQREFSVNPIYDVDSDSLDSTHSITKVFVFDNRILVIRHPLDDRF